MITQDVAQPVMSTDHKLLGVEVLTRFQTDGLNLFRSTSAEIMQGWTIHERRVYLIDIRYFITNEGGVFIDNKLFCSINIYFSTVLFLKHDAYVHTLIKSLSHVNFLFGG